MNNYKILTQYSPWFIILCILTGLGYAFLLYKKKSPWNKNTNYLLAGLRFLLVAILCFLLLSPFIKYFKNYTEKPTVVFAIDNSQSIAFSADSNKLKDFKNKISTTAESIQSNDIDIEFQTFDNTINNKEIQNINFNAPSSNISKLLKDIQSNFENRNLAGVVLLSDGIYNQGIAPNFNQYSFPIYTVGLGDTVPKKDISLKSLLYNKLSYLGNKFPIVAEIHNKGFKGQNINVSIKQNGKTLDSRTILLNSESDINKVEFYRIAESKGLQHFTIEITPLKGEFTNRNNIAHAYIDIIDNKEKILIAALAPHPDVKAIRNALEKKENYEVQLYIPGISEFKEDKYDLVIFHQFPDYAATGKNIIDKFLKENASILFIIGNQTNINQFNSINKVLNIVSRQGQKDMVTPSFNNSFDKFKLETEEQSIINNFPPLTVPYGEYNLKENADVILYQKIGSTRSTKPLFVASADRKHSVICGEGIWQCRLQEYQETQETKAFDKFIANSVQYLSSKEDKRKFRVYPINNEFYTSDQVLFEAEMYNDIFEKVYGQKIDLKITDEKGKSTSYSFANGENNSRFEVRGLQQGIYHYSATTVLSGKAEKSEGQFTVKELMLEALNTTADHALLRTLSEQTKGSFVRQENISTLAELISKSKPNSIIHSNEELLEMVNLTWLFFVFLALISTEWFLRKYRGSY